MDQFLFEKNAVKLLRQNKTRETFMSNDLFHVGFNFYVD